VTSTRPWSIARVRPVDRLRNPYGPDPSASRATAVEIIYRLSEGVLQRESDLLATVEACAELDWCALSVVRKASSRT
jgi:hypothetical protein